jgi:hypothetical protein
MHILDGMTPIEGSLSAVALAMAGPTVGLAVAFVSLIALSALLSVVRWVTTVPVREDEGRTSGRRASAWPAD